MNAIFNLSQRIGDIVSKFPQASNILKDYRIDFCCGGDRPLEQAVNEQGIDGIELLEALHNAYYKAEEHEKRIKDWRQESFTAIINHIVGTHHKYLKEELPVISELTTKILRVHGVDHGRVLAKVHRLFHNLKIDLEQHLIKEEERLFPIIQQYESHPTDALQKKGIEVMLETEEEHELAGEILKELRDITDDYTVPSSGCGSFRLTYEKLEALESDLFEHIHLENNILFSRFQGE